MVKNITATPIFSAIYDFIPNLTRLGSLGVLGYMILIFLLPPLLVLLLFIIVIIYLFY